MYGETVENKNHNLRGYEIDTQKDYKPRDDKITKYSTGYYAKNMLLLLHLTNIQRKM